MATPQPLPSHRESALYVTIAMAKVSYTLVRAITPPKSHLQVCSGVKLSCQDDKVGETRQRILVGLAFRTPIGCSQLWKCPASPFQRFAHRV